MIVDVVIPAFNEENSIGKVLQDIPKDLVREVVVVNNNSTDGTRVTSELHGATVVDQPIQGYGNACLMGMEHIANRQQQPDVIVFLDADYSDHPEELGSLLDPIRNGYDMVIGSRALGSSEAGAMMPQQVFGNWLATRMMRFFYGVKHTDLGPFRAIRYDRLIELEMTDPTYGWTIEMQLKAANRGFRTCEVPVSYRKRIGFSKITGTVKGTVGAGYKIMGSIFRYL